MNLQTATSEYANGKSNVPFSQLLDEYTYTQPRRGQIVEGKILRIDEDVIYVDIGAKRDALIPHSEVSELAEGLLGDISRGDQVPVYIVRTPASGDSLHVSLKKGLQKHDWDMAVKHLEQDDVIEANVVRYNKGGVLVGFGQLQGFVPNSHIGELRHIRNNSERQAAKAKMIGQSLPLKFLEVNRERNRLVLSEKKAQEEREQQRLLELSIGQVVTGQVVHLTDFGAFVDLGGVDGLIHISRLAHQRIDHPSEVVDVGDEVEVMIQDIDVERQRISLDRKVMLPNPWELFAERQERGDLVEGTVENITDFGLFIHVGNGLVGLAHISEIDLFGGATLEDLFRIGDEVLTRITDIDVHEGRLSLSLRQVSADEQMAFMAKKQARAEDEQESEVTPDATLEEIEAFAAIGDGTEAVAFEEE